MCLLSPGSRPVYQQYMFLGGEFDSEKGPSRTEGTTYPGIVSAEGHITTYFRDLVQYNIHTHA